MGDVNDMELSADKTRASNTKDSDQLELLGFLPEIAKEALLTRSREDAFLYLTRRCFTSDEVIWEPPLHVRIGSWLPNVNDGSGGADYTAYFVTVTLSSTNYSWQLSKRYALFYELYHQLKEPIAKAGGTKTKFPEQRILSFLFGLTDEVRDQRREDINGWFQEILQSKELMLDKEVIRKVFTFFEVSVVLH